MTETTSVAMIPPNAESKPGTVGKLLSTIEARLVSPEGKDVPKGESGELWLRGPNIMLRYTKNEKSTRETLTEDGWLMTGDICTRTEDGYYAVIDRAKELIKYSGASPTSLLSFRTSPSTSRRADALAARSSRPQASRSRPPSTSSSLPLCASSSAQLTSHRMQGRGLPPRVPLGRRRSRHRRLVRRARDRASPGVQCVPRSSSLLLLAVEHPHRRSLGACAVVPNPEHAKSPTLKEDVAAFVADKLAPHKRLRGGVFILKAIPKRCVSALRCYRSRCEPRSGTRTDPSSPPPSPSPSPSPPPLSLLLLSRSLARSQPVGQDPPQGPARPRRQGD